MEDQKSI